MLKLKDILYTLNIDNKHLIILKTCDYPLWSNLFGDNNKDIEKYLDLEVVCIGTDNRRFGSNALLITLKEG